MLRDHDRQPRARPRRSDQQSARPQRDDQRCRLRKHGIISAHPPRDRAGQADNDQIGGSANQNQRAHRGGARQAHPLAPDVHRRDDIGRQRQQHDRGQEFDQRQRALAGQRTDQLKIEFIRPQHGEPARDRHHRHPQARARVPHPAVDDQQTAGGNDHRRNGERGGHPCLRRGTGAPMRRAAQHQCQYRDRHQHPQNQAQRPRHGSHRGPEGRAQPSQHAQIAQRLHHKGLRRSWPEQRQRRAPDRRRRGGQCEQLRRGHQHRHPRFRPCQQPQRDRRKADQRQHRQDFGKPAQHGQRAPSGHNTTRTVCNRINRSRKGE